MVGWEGWGGLKAADDSKAPNETVSLGVTPMTQRRQMRQFRGSGGLQARKFGFKIRAGGPNFNTKFPTPHN